MLDELQVAEELNLPDGMSDIAIKRYVRKIYSELKITPMKLNRSTWVISEPTVDFIKEELWRLQLPKGKTPRTGMQGGRSKAKPFMNPQEFLTPTG